MLLESCPSRNLYCTRLQFAAIMDSIESSMLAAGWLLSSIHRCLLAGWLAAGYENDEEEGFQGILTRSSLEELGGLPRSYLSL